MSKMTISLCGKDYLVNCTNGEEERLVELARYVEAKMEDISRRSTKGTVTDTRLLLLTCIHICDELFDTRRKAAAAEIESEDLMIAAVEHLSQRIAHISEQVGRA